MKQFFVLLLTLYLIFSLTSILSAKKKDANKTGEEERVNTITIRIYGAIGLTVGKDDRVKSANPLNYRFGGQGFIRLFKWLSIGIDSSYMKLVKIKKVRYNYNGYPFEFYTDIDISYVNLSGVLEFYLFDSLILQAGVGPYFYVGDKIGVEGYEFPNKEIGIFFAGGSDITLSDYISIPIIGRIDIIFAETYAYAISVLSGISLKF